jgi:organic hydroperoxide reductase OsmC/OhrA
MHQYEVTVRWTGNSGEGTSSYRSYERSHQVSAEGPPPIPGSSDPAFRGDAAAWNPEQLLVASLSQCHMLWYLHLCADAGVVVVDYVDHAAGSMELSAGGGGHFTEVVLHPAVTVAAESMTTTATELHHRAHQQCFIANSVNFPVRTEGSVSVAPR